MSGLIGSPLPQKRLLRKMGEKSESLCCRVLLVLVRISLPASGTLDDRVALDRLRQRLTRFREQAADTGNALSGDVMTTSPQVQAQIKLTARSKACKRYAAIGVRGSCVPRSRWWTRRHDPSQKSLQCIDPRLQRCGFFYFPSTEIGATAAARVSPQPVANRPPLRHSLRTRLRSNDPARATIEGRAGMARVVAQSGSTRVGPSFDPVYALGEMCLTVCGL